MEFMHGINVELVVFLDNCLIRSTHASDSDTTKESLRFIEINQIDVKQKTLFSVGKWPVDQIMLRGQRHAIDSLYLGYIH